ncbi:ABC transporter permease [Brenneria populi subsp. brevivirga]|uniref:ABC transporter permease n=1 Tax=Brenneria populi TaxID=1505588 RepID=UPI002E170400|nr:ABC transporter permease [Brenneria populi subsp. brevivirga]
MNTSPGQTINAGYWQASPLAIVMLAFLIFPICVIVAVSFWDYDSFELIPAFIWDNYRYLIMSGVTWRAYANTLYYAVATWGICLIVGFFVAYYLAFHIRNKVTQNVLFLLCTVPFFTSNIIRMISWIPLLGRNGIINQGLIGMGLIDTPIEGLLYSDFSVILAFVHLNILFMVIPIFNSMSRIDRRLLEASYDNGASSLMTLFHVVVPLSKTGIVIGSVFVVTLVMGDFITVKMMSGGLSASVGVLIHNEIGLLQYPAAAANAVILLITVLMMLTLLFRMVDIKKEL